MNITMPIACEGEYRLIVSKDRDCKKISRDSGYFKNLILDSGLDIICSQGIVFANSSSLNPSMTVLAVGTSSVEPNPSQTSLVSQIATVSLVSSATSRSFTTDYARGYIEVAFSRQFPQGAAAGNISEIGCGLATNNLLSRALVRDSEGNPTTITILSDEFLTVHYKLRIYIPQNDITQNINVLVDGVPIPTTVTARPYDCNRTIMSIRPLVYADGLYSGFLTSGDLSSPSSNRTTAGGFRLTNYVESAYVPGTFERAMFFNLGTSDAVSDSLKILLAPNLTQSFQYLFDPPLKKTNQQTMKIRVGFKIGRPA